MTAWSLTHTIPLTLLYLQLNKSHKSLSGVLITLSAAVHLWFLSKELARSLHEISLSAVFADRDWDWRDLMQPRQLSGGGYATMGIMNNAWEICTSSNHCNYSYRNHCFWFQPSAARSLLCFRMMEVFYSSLLCGTLTLNLSQWCLMPRP